jgi:hypothetical protein
MSEHNVIPVCPWCGAEGHVTDCFGRPDEFVEENWAVWECGSGQQIGHQSTQSPECKDRVIAQQAAEITRPARSRW